MNFPLIANIVVFVVPVCAGSNPPQTVESGEKVLVGLVMGVVFGLALHTIYGSDSQYLKILYSGLTLLVTAMFSYCK